MSCNCFFSIIVGPLLSIVFFYFVRQTIRLLVNGKPKINRSPQESTFVDPKQNKRCSFPNLIQVEEHESIEEPTLYLSVIVPAYNEQDRLPIMMDETLEYLEKRAQKDVYFSYEVIVVDDGSKDNTSQLVMEYSERFTCDRVRLLKCDRNGGKGSAVRLGILSSRGRRLLFADADGATKFADVELLEQFMNECQDPDWAVAVGSRAHLQNKPIKIKKLNLNDKSKLNKTKQEDDDLSDIPAAERSLFRLILMYGFHAIVWICAVRTIKDTQCGFKMFGRKAAVRLFNALHVTGWAFDVELLSLCEHLRLQVKEIPVNWIEIDGSKIVPIFSWMAMGRDVITIAVMYTFGLWKRPSRTLIAN